MNLEYFELAKNWNDLLAILKKGYINKEDVELCKRFINTCWSPVKRSPEKARYINAYLAKKMVARIFDKYISEESFLIAAAESEFDISISGGDMVIVKYYFDFERGWY